MSASDSGPKSITTTRYEEVTSGNRIISELKEMEKIFLVLSVMLVTPVSAAEHLSFIESILLSIHQRPWLMGVYVFVVGLPMILFVSFMWPDKRFGPPDQPYYYKKSDDVQPDDPEISLLKKSGDTKGSRSNEETSAEKITSTHKRNRSKPFY